MLAMLRGGEWDVPAAISNVGGAQAGLGGSEDDCDPPIASLS